MSKHDITHHEAKPSTCTEFGWEAYEDCSRCDYTTYKKLPAIGHSEISHIAKDPTCTTEDWDAYVTCSRCDYSTKNEIPTKGHSFGNWYDTVAPGKETVGEERRDCTECEYYETREIEALGYLQAFVDSVTDLSKDQYAETTYNDLYAALQIYAKLTDEEKQEANAAFLVLQAAIESYNAKAMVANDEMERAIEIAFVPISASFTFLTALCFLLKKKFWIK